MFITNSMYQLYYPWSISEPPPTPVEPTENYLPHVLIGSIGLVLLMKKKKSKRRR